MSDYYLFLDDVRTPNNAYCYDEGMALAELSGIPNGSWEVVRSFDEFKAMIDSRGVPLAVSFDCDLCNWHVQHYMRNASYDVYEWENFPVKCGIHCAKLLKSVMSDNPVKVFIHSANHIGREIIRSIFSD